VGINACHHFKRHEAICELLQAIVPYATKLRKAVVVCDRSRSDRNTSLLIEKLNNDVFRKHAVLERVMSTPEIGDEGPEELTWFWVL
jgi:hypothetical protein